MEQAHLSILQARPLPLAPGFSRVFVTAPSCNRFSRNDAVSGPPPSRRLTALAVGEVNSHPRFWFTIQ